jgi:hypothetical protein
LKKDCQTSNWLATEAKELVRSQGILSPPNRQQRKARLAKCLEDIVNTFYESDKISHTLPAKKGFKSVKKDGKWIHIQKKADTW